MTADPVDCSLHRAKFRTVPHLSGKALTPPRRWPPGSPRAPAPGDALPAPCRAQTGQQEQFRVGLGQASCRLPLGFSSQRYERYTRPAFDLEAEQAVLGAFLIRQRRVASYPRDLQTFGHVEAGGFAYYLDLENGRRRCMRRMLCRRAKLSSL